MIKILFILVLSALSLEAATSYSVKEIKKILDKNDQVDAIQLTVTVTINGESMDGSTFLLPAARAAVLADASKFKEYSEKLAAETELRLIKKQATVKVQTVDPDSVTIDPVKVQEEKAKL